MSATTLTGDELTIDEAAQLCKVSPSTIRQWAKTGYRSETGEVVVLKRILVGSRVRFKRESLDEFVAACNANR